MLGFDIASKQWEENHIKRQTNKQKLQGFQDSGRQIRKLN